MPPRADEVIPVSTLGIQATKRRNAPLKTGDDWLDDRREIENNEGLWRIQDDLYDLEDFVHKHPGGSQWLELSKGTDITEAFEVHHLNDKARNLLPKFHVKKANTKRNVPFTFKEDGFYRTLKREVCKVLEDLPIKDRYRSNLVADCLMLSTFIMSTLALRFWNFYLGFIAAYLLTATAISGHNYFHMKDNFRMYYFTLTFMQLREWRIIHVLSHHLHTNTILDLEISNLEPILQYLPIKKTTMHKFGSPLYFPLCWMFSFHSQFIKRNIQLYKGQTNHLGWADLVPFILPTVMYFFGNQSFFATMIMWNFIMFMASGWFEGIGLNAAHHHPDIFHDGDTPRSKTDIDWGISQLDAVMDRTEVTGNPYLVLTVFGDHALHHMFPTIDHGLLKHLYPTFHRVCKQFDIGLRVVPQMQLIKGQFSQLKRTAPNPNPPDLLKKYT